MSKRSPIKTLMVSPNKEDHACLREILDRQDYEMRSASGCAEALDSLRDDSAHVVICERDLPDGNWFMLLQELNRFSAPPRLIVCSRLADAGLWAEVINLGGWDVLPTPFQSTEVVRVAHSAWRSAEKARMPEAQHSTDHGRHAALDLELMNVANPAVKN